MGFVRTASGDLVSLVDVSRLYTVEHQGGGHTIVAVLRSDGTLVKLARDYTIESLARALDPVRASR